MNKPKIRFSGYTEAWEQCKLSDAIEKLTGGASIAPEDYTEEGYRTIPKGAVNDSGVADMSGCKYVSGTFFAKNSTSKTSAGELVTSLRDLVPTAPNIGRIVRIYGDSEEFLMPQGVYSIKVKDNVSEDFLITYSNSPIYRKIIMAEKNGSTQVHIRNGEFLNIDFPMPSCDEQNKIGSYFRNLNNLITLHQRKCDQTKKLKKYMLQKMFPQNGELYPEIRFEGFTNAWEQRKLSDVVNVYDGVHQTPEYKDEGVMFLSVENITTLKSKKYISEEAFERDYKVYPEKGDILMTRIGDIGTPNVVESSEKLAFYVSLALLKPHGIDSYYLKNAIQSKSFQKGLRERSLLTAIPMKINKDEIGKVDVFIPKDIEEQKKIGAAFKKLDHLITLHQRKRDELMKIKKYMLQNMFAM